MRVHHGCFSGRATKVYQNYSLVPTLPGAYAIDVSTLSGVLVKSPRSQGERDEMALSGQVYSLPSRSESEGESYHPHRRRNYGGEGRALPQVLIRFESPEAVRVAFKEIVSPRVHRRFEPWNELFKWNDHVSERFRGKLDLTDSAAASDMFARAVRPLAVETTDDPVHDLQTRFTRQMRSALPAEDVLMLSAHFAWYWNRVGNYDLEVRYSAMMGYRVFDDASGARVAAMSMLGNIDALYDRMAAQGNPVDDRVRSLHDSFLGIVHERIDQDRERKRLLDEEKSPPIRESDRLRPPAGSRARALIPPSDGQSSMLNLTDRYGWYD